MKRTDQELSLLYFLSDLIALNATLLGAVAFYQGSFDFKYDGLTMVALSLMWVMFSRLNNVYQLHLHNSFRLRVINYVKSHFAFIGSVSTIYMIFTLPNYIKAVMITFVVFFPAANLLVNFLLFKLIGKLRTNKNLIKKAVIVGAGKAGIDIYNHYQSNQDFGYHIVGFLENNAHFSKVKNLVIGEFEDLDEVIIQQHIDEVIVAIPMEQTVLIKTIINKADYHGTRARIIPDFHNILGDHYSMSQVGEVPVVNVREISLDKLYLAIFKRVFDIVFSTCALIALTPVFIGLAMAIKMGSKGSVFYCPVRVGRNGKKFKVFKFRSMAANDNAGTQSTKKDDDRITKVGRIIRKYSLDELPQFLNVLLGDMSVVGPRPHRVFLNEFMQKEVGHYMLRSYLKPGITGWAQVNGWRGPTDTEEQRQQRTEHDLWYMDHWSLTLDAKIIYMTLFSEKTHQVAF